MKFTMTCLIIGISLCGLNAQQLTVELPPNSTGIFIGGFSGLGTYALALEDNAPGGPTQFIDANGVVTFGNGFFVIAGLDDVDGDGRSDFAGRLSGSGSATALAGPYSSATLTPLWLAASIRPLSRDVTGDGLRDWITLPPAGMPVNVLDGATGIPHTTLPPGQNYRSAGDFNGDGIADWTTNGVTPGEIGRLISGSDLSLILAPTASGPLSAPSVKGVGDLNGDGFDDIFISFNPDFYFCDRRWRVVYGGTLTSSQLVTDCTGVPMSLGDLDGDGRADSITPTGSNDVTALWLGDQFTSLGNSFSFRNQNAGRPSNLGDLNGDGVAEIGFGTSFGPGSSYATIWDVGAAPAWRVKRSTTSGPCQSTNFNAPLDTNLPLVGTDAVAIIRASTGTTFSLFLGSELASPLSVGDCLLFLDPTSLQLVAQGTLPSTVPQSGGVFVMNWGTIPNDPLLLGASFSLQAALWAPNGVLRLTNLVAGGIGEQAYGTLWGFGQ